MLLAQIAPLRTASNILFRRDAKYAPHQPEPEPNSDSLISLIIIEMKETLSTAAGRLARLTAFQFSCGHRLQAVWRNYNHRIIANKYSVLCHPSCRRRETPSCLIRRFLIAICAVAVRETNNANTCCVCFCVA